LPRRAAYSAGAGLIPLVRLGRLMPGLRRSRPDLVPRVLAPLLFALVIDSIGQGLGYALGAGQAAEKVARLEFHRGAGPTRAIVLRINWWNGRVFQPEKDRLCSLSGRAPPARHTGNSLFCHSDRPSASEGSRGINAQRFDWNGRADRIA